MEENKFRTKAELLRIMAHPTRLTILEELSRGVKCVSDIESLLGKRQPNISQHLTILRHNGLVDFYMDGKLRCYFLKYPELVKDLLQFLGKQYTPVKVPLGKLGVSALGVKEIRDEVRKVYSELAFFPGKDFSFPKGLRVAEALGYPGQILQQLPNGTVESFSGVGNPLNIAPLMEGEKVLDVGSGSGLDVFLAADMISPTGLVIGLEMTEAMIRKAAKTSSQLNLSNVVFLAGYAEEIPLIDGGVDTVISNGVINLSPEKERVLREIYRVLKDGGRLLFSDIVLEKPLSEKERNDARLWAG